MNKTPLFTREDVAAGRVSFNAWMSLEIIGNNGRGIALDSDGWGPYKLELGAPTLAELPGALVDMLGCIDTVANPIDEIVSDANGFIAFYLGETDRWPIEEKERGLAAWKEQQK